MKHNEPIFTEAETAAANRAFESGKTEGILESAEAAQRAVKSLLESARSVTDAEVVRGAVLVADILIAKAKERR